MIKKKGAISMLDFRVYTFLEVCKYMNFTKAAEALHITQPAVSQHIRFIEDYYQTRLFPSRAEAGTHRGRGISAPCLFDLKPRPRFT